MGDCQLPVCCADFTAGQISHEQIVLLKLSRIIELANKTYSLVHFARFDRKSQPARSAIFECSVDAIDVCHTQKASNMIFEGAKFGKGSGREDSNLRPPGPENATDLLAH
jgi:hypothetical protein